MAGPYNIDNDINAGDSGQLAWAEGVANAVNDLDLRAGGALWRYPITSGRVRIGPIQNVGEQWQFVEEDRIYFYPVYYENTFGVDGFGISLRGDLPSDTAYLGLYDSSNGGFPGDPVAQTTVSASTGWKQGSITAVTGIPAGWYWHASMFTGRLDVHGGFLTLPMDAPSIEAAVRTDQYSWKCLLTTGTHASLASDPTVATQGGVVPLVAVRFA